MKKELLTLDENELQKAIEKFSSLFAFVKPTKSAVVRFAIEQFNKQKGAK